MSLETATLSTKSVFIFQGSCFLANRKTVRLIRELFGQLLNTGPRHLPTCKAIRASAINGPGLHCRTAKFYGFAALWDSHSPNTQYNVNQTAFLSHATTQYLWRFLKTWIMILSINFTVRVIVGRIHHKRAERGADGERPRKKTIQETYSTERMTLCSAAKPSSLTVSCKSSPVCAQPIQFSVHLELPWAPKFFQTACDNRRSRRAPRTVAETDGSPLKIDRRTDCLY